MLNTYFNNSLIELEFENHYEIRTPDFVKFNSAHHVISFWFWVLLYIQKNRYSCVHLVFNLILTLLCFDLVFLEIKILLIAIVSKLFLILLLHRQFPNGQ